MAFGQQHVLGFSPDGQLFALIDDQGILRIWDTETNELKQEYTPNLHLTVPCTSLVWITATTVPEEKKAKKARKAASTKGTDALYLALGTSNGKISLYSYAEGKIERNLKGEGHNGRVTALTQDASGHLYSCGEDCRVVTWSVAEEKQLNAWSIGTEKPYSLAYMEHSHSLVIGARQIKVYSVATQELVQTFSGHTSEVHLMDTFALEGNVEYALTASRMERIICLWKIGKKGRNKSAACTLLMDNVAQCLTCKADKEGSVRVASVTNSGIVHMYLLAIDSLKVEKPLKPKLNIQIVSDSATIIAPIPAVAASLRHSHQPQELVFSYGGAYFMVFERLLPNYSEKIQVLTRTDPKMLYAARKIGGKKDMGLSVSLKTVTPIINDDVDYKSALTVSKKKLKSVELPMESRLQNLKLNATVGSGAPQAQSKVQLLVQSLHSKDAILLRSVLHTHDLKVIQLTLQKLPVQYVGTLVNELTHLMQQKRMNVEYAIKWLKVLAQTHSGQLMALGADDLLNKFGPCIGIIEHRANCLKELSKLSGRLQLLVSQIKRNTEEDNLNSENALVYEDNDSSNSEIEDTAEKSASDDEWDENDVEDDAENMEQDDNDDDDDDDDDDGDDDDDDAEEMET